MFKFYACFDDSTITYDTKITVFFLIGEIIESKTI